MFERFTGDARQVVVNAQEAARDLWHNYIGTEHVLLGLFVARTSVAARALRQVGLTEEMVRADVESEIGRGKEEPSGHIPFTPRAKKVLELALREALKLKHNYIGPEHILLGLVREGEGVAAKIMWQRVGDLDEVRKAVVAELSRESVEPGTGTTALRRHKTTSAAEEAVSAAEALAGAAPIGSHHLLEALVRAEGSMAARVLTELGVDPEVVAAKIDELDPEATTDATPEESAARRMELRLVEGEVQLVFRDKETIDLTQKIMELTGGPIRGTGPVSGAFVPLWTSTNELLTKLLQLLQGEPEEEVKGVLGMMRRVMRGRLRRPPESA